jgi:hypothetical protein
MAQYDKAVESFQQALRVFQVTSSSEEQAEVMRLLQEVQQERDSW